MMNEVYFLNVNGAAFTRLEGRRKRRKKKKEKKENVDVY